MAQVPISLSDVIHWCGWPCLAAKVTMTTVTLINHAGIKKQWPREAVIQEDDGLLRIHMDYI